MSATKTSGNYNNIPAYVFCRWFRDNLNFTILDIGCSDGENALNSKWGAIFDMVDQRGNYRGLDIEPLIEPLLYGIRNINVLEYYTARKFDLILMLQVLEHIEEGNWAQLLQRLMLMLKDGGSLVVSMPYQEEDVGDTKDGHHVFGIDEAKVLTYLPSAKIKYWEPTFTQWLDSPPRPRWMWLFVLLKRLLTKKGRERFKRQRSGRYHIIAIVTTQ